MSITQCSRLILEPRSGSRLLSVGSALPDGVLSNKDFEQMMATSDEWIRSRTGIGERRVGGTTTSLATKAARQALDRSGLDPSRIDLVIVATHTPDDLCPSTAAGVQHALGLQCGAFDLNAACSGFALGLVTAHAMLGTGARAALVIGADRMSSVTNYEDRSTAILFGDGAGAVVLEAQDSAGRGLQAWDVGSDGGHGDILRTVITDGTITGVEMDGKVVFKHMVRHAVRSAVRAVERADICFDDLSAVVAHQAISGILDAVADRLDVDREKFVSIIEHTGNTSAASVPLALDAAVGDGRIAADDKILLMGFGGGLSWASAVAVWQ